MGSGPQPNKPGGSRANAGGAVPLHLAALEAHLRKEATGFGFFQAVRTLQRLHPDRAGPGLMDPDREAVRFSVNPSIAFPPQEIHSLDLPADGPAQMSVNFFGLTGPQGVLPHDYSLLIAERLRARDPAMGAFFDMFNHRMLSLFYRAWERNQFTVSYEVGHSDRLSEHLLDLVGQGMDIERKRVVARETLPFYAGLLGPQQRSAVALKQLLEDMFDIPVEVDQFVGGWYPLATYDQCELGQDDGPSGQLGYGAVAGDEVWDQQTRVRLRLGPMTTERYHDFLPTGSAYALLRWVVRFFSRDAFDFEVQLVLARDEVRGLVLGDEETTVQPLGWTTWIRTQEFKRDADDTIIRLQA